MPSDPAQKPRTEANSSFSPRQAVQDEGKGLKKQVEELQQALAASEARLQQSLERESIATATAGLVHDFSNKIAGIFSLSELYCAQLEAGSSMAEGMELIKSNAMKARDLIRRIVDLNRERGGSPAYHDVRELLASAIPLLEAILPKGSSIKFVGGEETIPVYLDEVAFRHALLLLLAGARDAYEERPCSLAISAKILPAGSQLSGASSGASIATDCAGAEVQVDFDETMSLLANDRARSGMERLRITAEAAGGRLQADPEGQKLRSITLFLPCPEG